MIAIPTKGPWHIARGLSFFVDKVVLVTILSTSDMTHG